MRFKRLTDAEARTLTRAEILDRVEAEQQYWFRKRRGTMTAEDEAAEREFFRIMHAYVKPQEGLDALKDVLEGRRLDYWESRPEVAPSVPNEAELMRMQATLAVGHDRVFAALYPAEIVFVLPPGMAEGVTEWMGCKVIRGDVDKPMVAVPAWPEVSAP